MRVIAGSHDWPVRRAVEQARSIARYWLADVRRGKDPSAEKTAVRAAPSVEELCTKFIEDYSKPKDRPRTVECYQGYIDRHISVSFLVRRTHLPASGAGGRGAGAA